MKKYENTCTLCSDAIPDIAVEIVVTSQKKPTRFAEGYWSNTTNNIIMRVHCQLLVCPNIKQTNCSVIAASSECVTIRKELQIDTENWQILNLWTWINENPNKSFLQLIMILTVTALMSLSCPGNVCLHIPSLISHSCNQSYVNN